MILSYPATDTCSANIAAPLTKTFTINNGALQSGATIIPNDCLAPGNTFYATSVISSAGAVIRQNNFYVSTPIAPATQFNISTALPTVLTSSNISFDVSKYLVLPNVNCASYAGADASAKIAACLAGLSPAGGIANVSALGGAQAWSTCPFTGVTVPVTIIFGAGTTSVAVDCTDPTNIALVTQEGAIFSIASGKTLTINGEVSGTASTHFAGAGTTTFTTSKNACLPHWFGATADGTTDDTSAIYKTVQSCHNVYFPDGAYRVSAVTRHTIDTQSLPGAINPISNQTIVLSNAAVISQLAYVHGEDCAGRIFGVYSVSNVSISGGTLLGNYAYPTVPAQRLADCPTGSNHGYEIGNSSNIRVDNQTVDSFWGDGITVSYIGNQTYWNNSKNVVLNGLTVPRNYRNGISCVGWIGGAITNSDISLTKGAGSPEAGIDLEPNILVTPVLGNSDGSTSACKDITVSGTKVHENNGWGIQALNVQSQNLKFIGNTIKDQSNGGNGGFISERASSLVIQGNSFSNSAGSNIYLDETRSSTVTGNTINSGDGIEIIGDGLKITNITHANPAVVSTGAVAHGYVTGNVIELSGIIGPTDLNGQTVTITYIGTASFGIGVSTAADTAYVSDGVTTLQTRDLLVSNNNITNTSSGVTATTQNVSGGHWPVHDLNIVGNQMYTLSSICINLYEVQQTAVLSNNMNACTNGGVRGNATPAVNISNNTISRVLGSTLAHGIYVTGVNFGTINGNSISLANHSGIALDSGADNSVVGNYIYNASQATTLTYQGIIIVSTDRTNVQTNRIRGNSTTLKMQYSIRCTSGTDNWITNNMNINGGTTGSLSDACTTTNTTSGNNN